MFHLHTSRKLKAYAKAILFVALALGIPYGGIYITGLTCNYNRLGEPLYTIMYNSVYAASSMAILYLYVRVIMRRKLRDIGFKRPCKNAQWITLSFLLPIIVTVLAILLCRGKLIKTDMTSSEIQRSFFRTIFRGIGSGLVEESVFRGVILKNVEMISSKKTAVIVSSVLFTLLHLEQIISAADFVSVFLLFFAGISVCAMLSIITYSYNSIFPAIWTHSIWNIFMIGNVFSIKQEVEVYNPCIFTFVIDSKNPLLNGGRFGIEASIISIFMYLFTAAIAFYNLKHQISFDK